MLDVNKSATLSKGTADEASKTLDDICMSISNCGMIMGKPRMAIMAAFCWAFAAMAAKKLNTRLRLQPPNKTNPINTAERSTGYFMKSANRIKLSVLIKSISKELNKSLAKMKLTGLVMLW